MADTLNADQEAAIKSMHGFLSSSEEQFMVLEGPGGTGKTFVIKHFVRSLGDYHRTRKLLGFKGKTALPIYFTATTNKACEAMEHALRGLNAPIDGSEFPSMNPGVKTIHSQLGLGMSPDPKNPRKDILYDRDLSTLGKCLIIIDEASYIDEELWEWIQLKCSKGTKVIFVGDPAQLKQGLSPRLPAFDSGFRKASLHIVERFESDTAIYALSVELRKRILARDFRIPPCPIDGKHIVWLPRPQFDRVMLKDMSDTEWTFNTSKFLAFRNNRVQTYNKGLNKLIAGSREFQAGDYALNNHYVSGTKKSGNIRTDGLVFIDALSPEVKHGEHGHLVYLDGVDERKFFLPEDHKAISKVANRLFKEYEKDPESATGIASLKSMHEVKNTWVDLRPVYAQTVYKSQGSTFRRVYIDLADIGYSPDTETKMRMLYVACTRAQKQLFMTGDLI